VLGGLLVPLTLLLGCSRFVPWNVANSVERVHNLPCRSLIPYQTDTNPPDRLIETNFATVLNHHEIPANRSPAALDTLVIEHTQNVKASHCTVAHNIVPCDWYLQSLTPHHRTTNSFVNLSVRGSVSPPYLTQPAFLQLRHSNHTRRRCRCCR